MEGNVLERMSEAVEEASVLIIGLSSTYKESQTCRTEAEYAYRLKKEVIYVMAEDGYVPKGWLRAMLGNKLWFNPWGSKDGFEGGVQEVVKQIKKYSGGHRPAHHNSHPRNNCLLSVEKIGTWESEEVCR